jgi:alpha-tubulin suppressor-like RCC1 family protein
VCLTTDGEVYTFGRGLSGQLGHGGGQDEVVPRRVARLEETGVALVACGNDYTACVDETGVLYTFGFGAAGQVGCAVC